MQAMFFDVESNGRNLYDLMAIRFGVNSCQSLSTTGASRWIVVGYSLTFFHWIQEPAMAWMARLPSPLFSSFLFFLALLKIDQV